jgi:CheY-like chemotaxis protein
MPPLGLLIVAADADMRELFGLTLTNTLRCTTRSAGNAAAACRALRAGERFDAILFDLDADAAWTDCDALVACAGATPVIVVTGWIAADGRYRRRAFEAGAAAFVLKPCSEKTLAAAVRRVCRGERGVELIAPAVTQFG